MSEIEFDKYAKKGAYHWVEVEGGLRRLNAYTCARYGLVAEALLAQGINRDARVADMGCGDGALAGVIARRIGCHVDGIDTSDLAIGLARQAFRKRGLSGDFHVTGGYHSGLEGGVFDAVVCSDVIEHVRDPQAMLAEILRLLRPGGLAVLTTPIRFTELPLDPLHVQEWFVGDFTALCEGVFGPALQVRRSHPLFWYEAYTMARPWLGRLARYAINGATLLGCNPFLGSSKAWRCHTTQMIVLRKPA